MAVFGAEPLIADAAQQSALDANCVTGTADGQMLRLSAAPGAPNAPCALAGEEPLGVQGRRASSCRDQLPRRTLYQHSSLEDLQRHDVDPYFVSPGLLRTAFLVLPLDGLDGGRSWAGCGEYLRLHCGVIAVDPGELRLQLALSLCIQRLDPRGNLGLESGDECRRESIGSGNARRAFVRMFVGLRRVHLRRHILGQLEAGS